MKLFQKILGLFTKVKTDAAEAEAKAVAWIKLHPTEVNGFISLFSFVYTKLKGEAKMTQVLQIILAAALGSNYKAEYATFAMKTAEAEVQKAYNTLKSNGIIS